MESGPHHPLTDHRRRAGALVVVTGVPGAGKTTLGRGLAAALDAQFVSLDLIKEDLYRRGTGGGGRHELRLAAEAELAAQLDAGEGDAVVDIWVAPDRDTDRVAALLRDTGRTPIVELICRVPADLAVQRYAGRQRSGPHLPPDEVMLTRVRDAVDRFAPMPLGRYLEVDTSRRVDTESLAARLRAVLTRQPREEG